jgi:hypothetical protein
MADIAAQEPTSNVETDKPTGDAVGKKPTADYKFIHSHPTRRDIPAARIPIGSHGRP